MFYFEIKVNIFSYLVEEIKVFMMWKVLKIIFKRGVIKEKPNHANESNISFFDLEATLITGEKFYFNQLKGKKTLIVNTASKCGFTPQLNLLEDFQRLYNKQVTILSFPCNDFLRQEPGSNVEIINFCKQNYQVSFLMCEKITLKKNNISPVYKWLSDKKLNGWNHQQPDWNFCKYLIDENGQLLLYANSHILPTHPAILKRIN